MDFRELTYITTVAEYGSVTAAAKALYLSQPSLSAAITRIEDDAGVILFDRSKKPLVLTYAGEVYVDSARKILHLNKELRKRMSDAAAGISGKITFGIPPERAGYMLPDIICRFKKEYPKVKIELLTDNSGNLIDALCKEKVNFSILPKDHDELPDGFEIEQLYREPLYLAAKKGYIDPALVSGEGTISLENLVRYPLIAMQSGHSLRKKLDRLLHESGLSAHREIELGSCISAAQFALAGMGVAIVPEPAVNALSDKEKLQLYQTGTELDYWNINLVKKSNMYLSHIERRLIGLVRERSQSRRPILNGQL